MNLQDALSKEPAFNGHVAYHFRSGKFTYFLGYGVDSIVTINSSTVHSIWTDEELQQVIDIYRAKQNYGD